VSGSDSESESDSEESEESEVESESESDDDDDSFSSIARRCSIMSLGAFCKILTMSNGKVQRRYVDILVNILACPP
jgi:hypothetical protein